MSKWKTTYKDFVVSPSYLNLLSIPYDLSVTLRNAMNKTDS